MAAATVGGAGSEYGVTHLALAPSAGGADAEARTRAQSGQVRHRTRPRVRRTRLPPGSPAARQARCHRMRARHMPSAARPVTWPATVRHLPRPGTGPEDHPVRGNCRHQWLPALARAVSRVAVRRGIGRVPVNRSGHGVPCASKCGIEDLIYRVGWRMCLVLSPKMAPLVRGQFDGSRQPELAGRH
jgi:hypothetical protein